MMPRYAAQIGSTLELVSQSSLAGFSLLRIDRLRRAISWFARKCVKDMCNADGLRKIKIDDLGCTRFMRQALLPDYDAPTRLIWEMWVKSFRRRDEERQPPDDDSGNPSVDFRGETLRNETHRSIMDPEARLMRKGKGREAKLGTLSWRTATGC